MRVKLVFLAGSLAAFVTALVFGADMCAQIGQRQQDATLQASDEAVAVDEDDSVPSPTEGGVQNVNQNLRKMKSGIREQMDRRGGSLDDKIERSGAGE